MKLSIVDRCYDRMKVMDLFVDKTKQLGFYERFLQEYNSY